MNYVYCTRPSGGAKELIAALKAKGKTVMRLQKNSPRVAGPKDVVINWGSYCKGNVTGAGKLWNGNVFHNKFEELRRLNDAGIPVPSIERVRPATGEWLARRFHHVGADDLLAGLKIGDYYAKWIPDVVREFRVHVFNGHSIRAGMKVPRDGVKQHPRFRSYDGGWKLDYGNICQDHITNRVRMAAKDAVAALKYDFGAVDVGLRADGSVVVFEVNSAPGLEGVTIEAYARHFAAVLQ